MVIRSGALKDLRPDDLERRTFVSVRQKALNSAIVSNTGDERGRLIKINASN
jgi:hypothetical protein